MQVHMRDAFIQRIGPILRTRTQSGISKGSLVARPDTQGKGTIALVTRLPGGNGFLLSVCNFSRNAVTETISLAGISGLGSVPSRPTPIALGGRHKVANAQTIVVSLGPWEGHALLLGGATNAQPAPAHKDFTPIPLTPVAPPMPLEKPQPDKTFVPKVVLDLPEPRTTDSPK